MAPSQEDRMTWFSTLALVTQAITVGPAGQYQSIGDAIRSANAGDTIEVGPGTYHEHLVIHHPIVIRGQPGAIIDGDGTGRVFEIHATSTLEGLTIRGSGANLSREDAGIWMDKADNSRLIDNQLTDVLFGIYIKESRNPLIDGNRIQGKDLPTPRRGDGIRLWYSQGGTIRENAVSEVRDVAIWFCDSTVIERNTITKSRYGLHYMYSDHNRFSDNRFEGNEVGAFVMYSNDVTFTNNVFAYALGSFGKGLGFKDTDRIVADSNLIVKNAIGVYLDNSPNTANVFNTFSENVFAFNDVGIQLLPSVRHNRFVGNAFLNNLTVVNVTGRGTATGNTWAMNFWSEYTGLDDDNDGYGDTPFVFDRVADDLLSHHEDLQIYRVSTATAALELLSRLVPVLKPTPILVDSLPSQMHSQPESTRADQGLSGVFGLLVFGLTTLSVTSVYYVRRRRA